MKLYIMRHGPAEDHAPTGRDADRALTTSGRDRVRSVARCLASHGEAPLAIVSSPLVRAFQTAEIVAAVTRLDERVRTEPMPAGAAPAGAVTIRGELAPGGAAHDLVVALAREGWRDVMLVGHEPDLSILVARLVDLVPPEGFLKAMVIGVELSAAPAGATGSGFTSERRFVLDPKTLVWDRG